MDDATLEAQLAAAAARTHRRRVWAFFVILVIVTIGLFGLRFAYQNEGPREGETTRIGAEQPDGLGDAGLQGEIVVPPPVAPE